MKVFTCWNVFLLLTVLLCLSPGSNAQSPGTIVKPMNGNGVTILNPNGDKFSSKTTAGFTTSDITDSEVPFKVVPPVIGEVGADNSNGPSGGFTDIINDVDGSGFYAYFDGVNLLYRLRMGGINNGAKSYSVLLDTDMKFGNTGQYADTNYIAPGIGTPNGNPGFEFEIVFSSQFDVTVYNLDGKTKGTVVATYPLNTHSQISVALSKHGGDADYFYDWGVPVASIGNPALVRFVVSAQISPHPAIVGNVSDVFGINDNTITTLFNAWTDIVNSQCGFSTAALASASPLCATCTRAPTINPVTATGANVAITGNWVSLHPTKPNTATISLYRNGTLVGTTTATTGMGWSITVPMVYSNDIFTAKAKATDESECLASPPILGGCSTPPTVPVISCAGWKGIEGLIPLGAEVIIFEVTSTGRNLLTAGLAYTNNATDRKFDFYGTTGQSGNACTGNVNDLASGTYELITNLNGCYSRPTFICITGSNGYSSLTMNSISLNTPILNTHTSVTGNGATAGEVIRLYRNGNFLASQTASASTFTFSGLTLFLNDELKVYSQRTVANSCMTASNPFSVTCFTTAPAINTNNQGEVLSSSSSISGTSPEVGATVNLFKGSPSTGIMVGNAAVASNKTWFIGGLTLVPGETYYATCTVLCESAASKVIVVRGPTTVCPAITGTYNEKSTVVNGTMPSSFSGKIRLYLDGALIDSANMTNATTWSMNVNTSNYNKLYPYGVLRATAEGVNLGEGPVCSSVTIQCAPPTVPDVNPSSVTIFTGQSATFNVTNPVDTLLYSIWDEFGNNYASSKFGQGSATLVVPSYTFSAAGTYNLKMVADRLTGTFCYSSRPITVVVENVTLAAKFISLFARKEDGRVKITWKVTNEENVQFYKVERSLDGQHFEQVAAIPYLAAAGEMNTYTAIDQAPLSASKLYYRVQLVDNNARFLYSHVATINGGKEKLVQIVPNPARSNTKLYIESKEEQAGTAELFDMNGKKLMAKKIQLYEGANMVSVEGLDRFAEGNYILRVTTKSGHQHLKLVIQ